MTKFAFGSSPLRSRHACIAPWRRAINKMLLVMKLTILLMAVAIFSVRASGVAQTVTISGKDLSLKEIFAAIKLQTGFVLLSKKELLANTRPVTLTVYSMPLDTLLDVILKGQPLEYEIQDKTIVLSLRNIPSGWRDMSMVVLPITGTIRSVDGQLLSGASVRIKGRKQGVTVSADGTFSINAAKGDILVVSYIGFQSREIKVEESDMGIIVLEQQDNALNEVTVSTGYWTTTKRRTTGSMFKVTSKDIEKQPLSSPLLALQGRVPGLIVSPQSGAAVTAPKLRVRGENSLRFDGGMPLYVIDGVVMDSRSLTSQSGLYNWRGIDPLAAISVGNIESIEVLKDADATAIYGSQGANGVILITTKKGATDGRSSFEITSSYGIGKVPHFVEMLNREQYLKLRRDAYSNANMMPDIYAYDLNGVWDTTRYTDWQRLLLGGTSNISNNMASFTGGTKQTSFRLSGEYYKETSFLSNTFGNRRISGSFNFNHRSSNQRLNISFTANYGSVKNKLVNSSTFVRQAMELTPVAPALYNEDGTLNWAMVDFGAYAIPSLDNPMAEFLNDVTMYIGTSVASSRIGYEVFPGLRASVGLNFTDTDEREVSKFPIATRPPLQINAYSTGRATFGSVHRNSWLIEPQLDFKKEAGPHRIEILVGAAAREDRSRTQGIAAEGYTSDVLLDNLMAAKFWNINVDDETQYRYVAVYGRVGYGFKDKYLLNLTGRRDGSSRFGPGKQYGNFASVGAGWIFSEEPLIRDHLRFLSFGKLRGSYGITGNDQIGDYQFYDLYDIAGRYQGNTSIKPYAPFNPEFRWESNVKMEAALSLGFLKDRISAEGIWYRNRSSSQLIWYRLPGTTGFYEVFRNFEATVQNAGLEFILNTRNISSRQFNWNTLLTISFPRNKLVAFPGIENTAYGQQYKVGESLSIQSLYDWKGIDPMTGTHITSDKTAFSSENLDPKYDAGMNNSISYRSFECSFFLHYSKSRNRGWISEYYGLPGSQRINTPAAILDKWEKPGDIKPIAKATTDPIIGGEYYKVMNSNYALTDASYIKLRSASLSYAFPARLLSQLKMRELKLFAQGQNLLTFGDFIGLDPETGVKGFPQLRQFNFGIQAKF